MIEICTSVFFIVLNTIIYKGHYIIKTTKKERLNDVHFMFSLILSVVVF